VGRALAADIGWRFEDASRDNFQRIAAAAADRRESLVIAAPQLEPAERDAVGVELRRIRWVQLRPGAPEHQPYPDLAIDSTQPIGAMIAGIRNELGI